MRVLFLASEATPYIKVGGLGDVAGELPPALLELGLDIRLALPLHPQIDRNRLDLKPIAEVNLPRASGVQPTQVFLSERNSPAVYWIDGKPVRGAQAIYGDPALDAEKYTFFSLAALAACKVDGWRPDVVHANDWHTAPAISWLEMHRAADRFWAEAATLLVVHNLAFLGAGGQAALQAYGIPPSDDIHLPEWARGLPLPHGLASADWLGTVSPGYAREIQTAEFGCGLERFLKARNDRIVGILNGLDMHTWDPKADRALDAGYSWDSLDVRRGQKRTLTVELGLGARETPPLIGMITRLDHQKGVDIALEALGLVLEADWNFVLLGTGDPLLEQRGRDFAQAHPERVVFIDRFDPRLARRIYAGADMLLVPSRYEPCGLAQMIGMRYGCVPIVRATGGLKDTVVDYSSAGDGVGFVFEPADPQALSDAIRRALVAYRDRRRWTGLQRRGMKTDFSWDRSAHLYADLYHRAKPRQGRDV